MRFNGVPDTKLRFFCELLKYKCIIIRVNLLINVHACWICVWYVETVFIVSIIDSTDMMGDDGWDERNSLVVFG